MRDLRRRALESNKTVSRKAQSKQVSTSTSKVNSAQNSRPVSGAVSRQGSDDEEDALSDGTSWRSVGRLLSVFRLEADQEAAQILSTISRRSMISTVPTTL